MPRTPSVPTSPTVPDFLAHLEMLDLATVRPHPRNDGAHPPDEISHLRESIREHDIYRNVVVAHDGTLLAGHGVVQAAQAEGKTHVPGYRMSYSPDDPRALKLLVGDNHVARLREQDDAALAALLSEIAVDGAAALLGTGFDAASMQALLDSVSPDNGAGGGGGDRAPSMGTLAERFLVPPFSVLDARQGYWQERKRAWIALGIQSELGRGGVAGYGPAVPGEGGATAIYRGGPGFHYPRSPDNGLLGFSQQARSHYNAAPGGSSRDATILGKDGHTQRGDGRCKPLARTEGSGRPGELAAAYKSQGRLTALQKTGNSQVLTQINSIFGPPEDAGAVASQSGTSIFDPVLCELAYRWFCPPAGSVLDPFAGGSVRGIVAAKLGRSYTGIDLRPEQVAANVVQWAHIGAGTAGGPSTDDEPVMVKVSAASARLGFHGCEPDYIQTVCHAACCESTTSPTGILVTIHPSEVAGITQAGGVVVDGLLQPRPGEKRCCFKGSTALCSLHATTIKPFGCRASPFTLNAQNTLIVRNRYKLLKCYKDGQPLPAYVAFRASLDLLFGVDEAARICAHLDAGGGDIVAPMPAATVAMLHENDALKHPGAPQQAAAAGPQWLVGDSRALEALPLASAYDFIFTCPPYADLEQYSDDPRDLSTMDYPDFLAGYRAIIAQSVARLKEDRFACIVVGDIRDGQGLYRNFVSDTVTAFHDAGARLYNEAILVTAVGSLPLRAGIPFTSTRKLGKTHQNVLIFVKGDARRATAACGPVDVTDALEAVRQRDELSGAPDIPDNSPRDVLE